MMMKGQRTGLASFAASSSPLLLLVLLLATPTQGIITETKPDKDFSATYVTSFGFLEGGTVTFNGILSNKKISKNDINCSVCTNDEYVNILTTVRTVNSNSLRKNCKTLKWGATYNITKSDFYRIFLHHTKGDKDKAQVVLLNPNGEHLSVGYIKLPSMYSIPAVTWTGVGTFYLIVLAVQKLWRTHVEVNGINFLIAFAIITRVVYCIVSIVYWRYVSANGIIPPRLFYLRITSNSLFEVVTLGITMALARGWYIMIPPRKSYGALVTLFGLLFMLFFYYQDENRAMYIGIITVYFFMVPQLTGYCVRNANLLMSFIRLGNRMNENASFDVVQSKLDMFLSVRSICVMTFFVFCLSKSIVILSTYSNVWIVLGIIEAAYFLILFSLYYVINPFNKSRIFDRIDASEYIGPAARMAAHPYEGTDPNTGVFVRDDFEDLMKQKKVAVVKSFDGKTHSLAIQKDVLRK